MLKLGCADIRYEFYRLKANERYVTDKSGCKMLEIIHASFVADEEAIFGKVNEDYVAREMKWYLTESLNVNDIEGKVPEAWRRAASSKGEINSNYGWMVFSEENGYQYRNCFEELLENPESRRAVMIYNRPTMWKEYDRDGMSDFVCTFAHQYFIRNGKLDVSVTMRSNDVVFGYKNDRAWADYVLKNLARDLGVDPGSIYWHAGSLHVYERHFNLIA